MWIKIASIILRYRILILVVVGIITAWMFVASRKVEMSYQMAQVLPPSDPAYKDYKKYQSVFGEEANVIVIAVKDTAFFNLDHMNAWSKLETSLGAIGSVKWTLSPLSSMRLLRSGTAEKFDYRRLVSSPPASQQEADSIRDAFASMPFYKNILWNPDSASYLLLAGLDEHVIHTKKRTAVVNNIQQEIARFEKEEGRDVHVSGLPFIRTDTVARAKKETILFTILAAIVSSIILFIFFKSFRVMGVALSQVLISVVWSWGSMGVLGYQITVLTGIIPPLLIVIGIPNAVYMVTKYQQEFLKTGNRIRALARMIEKTGKAMFLINVTTAVGFATLIITPGKMLMEFGVVATINVMLLFLLSLVWTVILFSYLPNPRPRHMRHLTNKRSAFFIDVLVMLVQRHRNKVFIISAMLLLVSIVGILRINTSGKVADDVPRNSDTYRDLAFFERNFNGVMPFEIMIDTRKDKRARISQSLWKKIDALQDTIAAQQTFSRAVSFIDLIKYANQSYYRGNVSEYRLPNGFDLMKLQAYIRNSAGHGSDSLLQSYVDPEGRYVRVSAKMKDIGTYEMEETISEIRRKTEEIFKGEDVEITISGASVVILKGTEYLLKNLISSISVAILLIALMMAPMFRKVKMVFISLIPNILPLVFTAGVMGFFNIPLKASTIIIYGIAFGITVDSTIHYLAKYLQELKYHKGKVKEATYGAIRDTALSMAYTSMILFFGFSVFIASDFGGTKALGILISFTLLMGFFCNLTLLPALLLALHKKEIDADYNMYTAIEDDDDEELQEREPVTNTERT